MKRSIKTKLLWALTTLVAGALIVSGGILIWQNTQQMREEIYLDALSFAELTHDEIVESFSQNKAHVGQFQACGDQEGIFFRGFTAIRQFAEGVVQVFPDGVTILVLKFVRKSGVGKCEIHWFVPYIWIFLPA